MRSMFNCDFRRVGGLRFLKVGRLTVSWSVSAVYRPIGARVAVPVARPLARVLLISDQRVVPDLSRWVHLDCGDAMGGLRS
jgi:hypothetical protein